LLKIGIEFAFVRSIDLIDRCVRERCKKNIFPRTTLYEEVGSSLYEEVGSLLYEEVGCVIGQVLYVAVCVVQQC